MNKSNFNRGDFFRPKGENIRWVVLKVSEDSVFGLRTYNRDPKKFYTNFYKNEEIIRIDVPKVRVKIFIEAVQNYFEMHGSWLCDNLTYIELLDTLKSHLPHEETGSKKG